ncbi:MAG: aspartate/glutamate racemase family protein [Paracoccus sp. (in: a-proteobacteria)]|nr:aspartate/glutamate racemase family protein [Paracoccus sp. (in: a-proteobacteria)]
MILLANPNADTRMTRVMCDIAARHLALVRGWTAANGPLVIQMPSELQRAAQQVALLVPPRGCRGVIVSAFGDPGAVALAARLSCPVLGIGAAAAMAAGAGGRSFAVATTTPYLAAGIDALMSAHAGQGRYLGCFLTEGPALAVMGDPTALDRALLIAATRAADAGAQAVIIGGGPLAQAAERIAPLCPVPLIQPIPEAARLIGRMT